MLAAGVVVIAGLALAFVGAGEAEQSLLGSDALALHCDPHSGPFDRERPRQLCVWDRGAAGPRGLTPAPIGHGRWPTWSPDGRRLAFVHTHAGPDRFARDDLYVIKPDGSSRVRLATRLLDPSHRSPFAWAPDGTRIVVSRVAPGRAERLNGNREFYAGEPRVRSDLYLIDVRTRKTRRLTRSATLNAHPAWLSSGLVYARTQLPVTRFRSELRIIAAGRDRLLRRVPGVIDHLVGSPDGRTIAMFNADAGRTTLWLLNVVNGRRTVLNGTRGEAYPHNLAWSPDARKVAIEEPGGLVTIKDVRTRRSMHDRGVPCTDPDWSPDGRRIACSVGYGEERPERRTGADIILFDPMTLKQTPLTDSGKAQGARWRPRMAR